MAESIIILRADADQAEREIRELGDTFTELGTDSARGGARAEASLQGVEDAARGADRALDGAGKTSLGWGQKMNTAANVASAGMNGLNIAVGLVRGSTELAKKSMEGFFRQSEEGEALFEDLRLQWGELVGKLTEMILGTTDVDEAFQKLSNVITVLTTATEWTVTAMTTLYDLYVRFTPQGWLLNEMIQTIGETMLGTNEEAFDLLGTTESLTEAFEGLNAITLRYAGSVESIQLRDLGDEVNVVARDTARLILAQQGIVEGTQDWDDNYRRLVQSLEDGDDTFERLWRRTTQYGDGAELSTTLTIDLSNSLEQMGFNGETAAASLDAVREQLRLAEIQAGETGNAFALIQALLAGDPIAVDGDDGARASRSRRAGESEEDAAKNAARLLDIEMQALGEFAQAQTDDHTSRLEAEAAYQEELRALKFGAFAEERLAREADAELIAQADADRLRKMKETSTEEDSILLAGLKSQRAFTESALQGVASIIAGEEGAQEAFMRLIGNKLTAEGSAAIFRGGIKLFDPLTAGMGAAEIAAGIAAIGAGQAIASGIVPGASSAPSAVSQGAAAPAIAQPQQVDQSQQVEIVNNFGIATNRREVASAVNDAMEDAKRFGYRK